MTKKKEIKTDHIIIMNVSKHAIFTDQGRVEVNEFGTCARSVGESLIIRGDAEEYLTDV